MTKKNTFAKTEVAKKLAEYKLPRYEELTPFPVLMHQLLKILDSYLSIFCVPGEEKILTQSMINSYVYKRYIAPPVNKEYTRDHLIYLIAVGILKQIMPISEVSQIIALQTAQYPKDVAYNYMCEEIEAALHVTFGTRSFAEFKPSPTINTELSETFNSAAIAFANKIYVKHSLYYTTTQE